MKTATFLLLLFQCSLYLGVLCDTLDPCKCETQIFESDEMSGTIKFQTIDSCPEAVSCLVYIKPRAGYVVSLEDRVYLFYQGQLKLFYYQGEKDETEMITILHSGGWTRLISETPVGIGLYVNYTKSANREGDNFNINFERLRVDETRKTCPSPILNVNSSIQVLNSDDWPSYGCAFRVQSDKIPAITMHRSGYFLYRSKISLYWKGEAIEPEVKRPSLTKGAFYTLDNGTDVLFQSYDKNELEYHEKCELSFVAPEYNPCNCSQQLYTLESGKTINIQSPGYPEMFCPMISCNYFVNMTNGEDHDHMNTFVIEAIHMPQGGEEELFFKVDDETVQLEKWFGKTSMNILTGNQLEISYTALSVLSSEHGFSMNITVYKQPNDCRCPTNAPKIFRTDDVYEMSIPPHCTHMMCRFSLQNSSLISQTLHLDINYTFNNEVLHVKGNNEFLLHTEPNLKQHHSSDIKSNNSEVMITYLRKGIRKGLNSISHLNMKWHWVAKNECNCGKTSFMAEPAGWSSFFSPRHPEDYCNNVDCTYRIWAPDGHHIQFMTKNFETEIHRDTLTFTEGKKILKQMTGHISNKTNIQTIGQHGTVHFHSDGSVTAKGFIVSFIAVPNVDVGPEMDTTEYTVYFVVEVGGLILLFLIIGFCMAKLYDKGYFTRVSATLDNPVYSFSANSDEVMMIVDKA